MFDKSQVTCNCFGAANLTQQKFFLARKRQPQEYQQPQSVRRVIKSTQIKNETEGKGQKKSLKKKPGSFVHSDNNYSASNEPNKAQAEIKNNFLPELPMKNKHSLAKGAQTPTLLHSNPLVSRFPQTTTSSRQPVFVNNSKQYISNKPNGFHYVHHDLPVAGFNQNERNNFQLRPQLLQFQNQTNHNYKPTFIINQKDGDRIKQEAEPKTFISSHQIPKNQFITQSNPYYSQKSIRLQTESWTPPSQNPLLIEDFQKLFKNKEDNSYNKNATKQKTALKPREAQQSKRFHQQQLMGRFAQSQDEDCSESPQSQVIGKGFDRTYQDLLDQDQPIVIEQTKASRSTNTKVSNLKGQKHIFDQHQRSKFGNPAHFTSYDRL